MARLIQQEEPDGAKGDAPPCRLPKGWIGWSAGLEALGKTRIHAQVPTAGWLTECGELEPAFGPWMKGRGGRVGRPMCARYAGSPAPRQSRHVLGRRGDPGRATQGEQAQRERGRSRTGTAIFKMGLSDDIHANSAGGWLTLARPPCLMGGLKTAGSLFIFLPLFKQQRRQFPASDYMQRAPLRDRDRRRR